ncbi:Gfo/Idh/MocA family protein [Sphingomonas astaxanthinifaciens]|uniref:Galactose 1-dehydrogenase n=1 Tax=Sphingomonas astaxanthinifaciens DSM 22298 TaxID=1123267 RepID=A0ABQ5Z850_9SPHN|nr:Gfo/Idh/MocA family oxidoreductase [Sphingomonas astaxanthinifaciens]GLR48180.1 galactose 1-dehydrogenase [Sphingomonas astaxanthinifaciens DSM 22298]
MTPIRIAIIGFGKIAEDQHQPAILGNPRFALAGSSSRQGKGPEPAFTDWHALLDTVEGLEAAAITTPPAPRFEIARLCISRGLHLLLEKPPCATLGEIEELRRLAAAKGTTLFTTWHAQHNAGVAAAKKLLAGQRIRSMHITWHEDVHKWHPGQQWVFEPGGFGVFDPGINAFSVATAILPGPLFVSEGTLSFPVNAQTPIAAELRFTSPAADGPLSASLDWRKTDGEEWTIRIETGDGQRLDLIEGGARLFLNGDEVPGSSIGEYPDLYRTFADLIDRRASLVDVEPLRLVADSLLVARRETVEAVTV